MLLSVVTALLAPALLPAPSAAPANAVPRGATRRWAVQAAGAAAAAAALGAPRSALADEAPSRMGGLLEPFVDVQRGYKMYVPTGWNKFDADPGVYDVKYTDIIEPETTVQVS